MGQVESPLKGMHGVRGAARRSDVTAKAAAPVGHSPEIRHQPMVGSLGILMRRDCRDGFQGVRSVTEGK